MVFLFLGIFRLFNPLRVWDEYGLVRFFFVSPSFLAPSFLHWLYTQKGDPCFQRILAAGSCVDFLGFFVRLFACVRRRGLDFMLVFLPLFRSGLAYETFDVVGVFIRKFVLIGVHPETEGFRGILPVRARVSFSLDAFFGLDSYQS